MRETLRLGDSVVSATLSLVYRPKPLRDELEQRIIAIANPSSFVVDVLERQAGDVAQRFGYDDHGVRYLVTLDVDAPGVAFATRPFTPPRTEYALLLPDGTIDPYPDAETAKDAAETLGEGYHAVKSIRTPWEPA